LLAPTIGAVNPGRQSTTPGRRNAPSRGCPKGQRLHEVPRVHAGRADVARLSRLVLIEHPVPPFRRAVCHGAQADAGNLQSCFSEANIFHRGPPDRKPTAVQEGGQTRHGSCRARLAASVLLERCPQGRGRRGVQGPQHLRNSPSDRFGQARERAFHPLGVADVHEQEGEDHERERSDLENL
jgi:hypothetical protein